MWKLYCKTFTKCQLYSFFGEPNKQTRRKFISKTVIRKKLRDSVRSCLRGNYDASQKIPSIYFEIFLQPIKQLGLYGTSQDRPKSAPYPRLKNSKRTSKCQFTVLENRKTKKWTEWRGKRRTFPILSTFLSQLKGGPFGEKTNFRKKVSQCRNKLKGGTLWSRPVWYVMRKNRKNPFGSVR